MKALISLVVMYSIIMVSQACNKEMVKDIPDEPEDTEQDTFVLAPCIKKLIQIDTNQFGLCYVFAQKIEQETHYWMNTCWADVNEFILNENCDTVCYRPGWFWEQEIGDRFGFDESCQDKYFTQIWTRVWPE
jgi:hypothetical protein